MDTPHMRNTSLSRLSQPRRTSPEATALRPVQTCAGRSGASGLSPLYLRAALFGWGDNARRRRRLGDRVRWLGLLSGRLISVVLPTAGLGRATYLNLPKQQRQYVYFTD